MIIPTVNLLYDPNTVLQQEKYREATRSFFMTSYSREEFTKAAVCIYGDGYVPADLLYQVIQHEPISYSGTSVALYQVDIHDKSFLLKVFSRNWSLHTKNFFEWAYGPILPESELEKLAQSVFKYSEKLQTYGLLVDTPLSIFKILDPYQDNSNEKALAFITNKYTEPSIRKILFELRSKDERDQIRKIYRQHIEMLLGSINKANKLGDVSNYIINYGIDLKPRNLIYSEKWIYIDLFPILTPRELMNYRKNAPTKAFMKRFDTRYYIYDLLLRYYKIVPDMINEFIEFAKQRIDASLESQSRFYKEFLMNYIENYISKWGHMPPDKDWQFPFQP